METRLKKTKQKYITLMIRDKERKKKTVARNEHKTAEHKHVATNESKGLYWVYYNSLTVLLLLLFLQLHHPTALQ